MAARPRGRAGRITPRSNMSTTTLTRLEGTMSQRLRTSREEAGYTQQALADLIGTCLKTIHNYENRSYAGARKKIVVGRWAELTGRDFEELWPSGQEFSCRACYAA